MGLQDLGYYNNSVKDIDWQRFTKLSYISIISSDKCLSLLNSNFLNYQVNILESIIRKNLVKKYDISNYPKKEFLSLFDGFVDSKNDQNSDFFKFFQNKIFCSQFNNPELAQIFNFLMFDVDIRTFNRNCIANNKKVAKYYAKKMDFLRESNFLTRDIDNIDVNFLDFPIYKKREEEFQKIYSNFKRLYNQYIYLAHTLFNYLMVNGKEDDFLNTFKEIIDETEKSMKKGKLLNKDDINFYLSNSDIYNLKQVFNISKKYNHLSFVMENIFDFFGYYKKFLFLKINYKKKDFKHNYNGLDFDKVFS